MNFATLFSKIKIALGAPPGTTDAQFTFALLTALLSQGQKASLRARLVPVREAVAFAVGSTTNSRFAEALEWLDGGIAILS